MSIAKQLIEETRKLSNQMDSLSFSDPVAYVYNPLNYARSLHEEFLNQFGNSSKKIIFLGMNPGPFGMAQTGIPFGEINIVQNWLNLFGFVGHPPKEHPAKPVEGFACRRSEVSGKRLWGLFKDKFETPASFFENHFVVNYCPLLFTANNDRGRNVTPDELIADERKALLKYCDSFLARLVKIMNVECVVGVGAYAEAAAKRAIGENAGVRFVRIIHPSPASPLANKNWAGTVEKTLIENSVWKKEEQE